MRNEVHAERWDRLLTIGNLWVEMSLTILTELQAMTYPLHSSWCIS